MLLLRLSENWMLHQVNRGSRQLLKKSCGQLSAVTDLDA